MMKETLSRSAAAALAGAAILTRLFFGLMVEAPEGLAGAWLSAAIAPAIALPALWLMARAWRKSGALIPALMVLTILDAASTMACAAYSESCLAFSHVSAAALMLPLALATIYCAAQGGDALGASARVWLWALTPLLIVTALCQATRFRPAWLLPLLGEGPAGILRAGVRGAGWIAMLAGATMLLCEEAPGAGRVSAVAAVASLASAGLMVLRLMMTPSPGVQSLPRSVLVDSLLTNGRAPLDLQLPMIVIWFASMLLLLCFECFAGAALLKRCLPALPYGLCAALSAGAALALAATGAFEALDLWALRLPLLAALSLLRRREAAVCAG